ncbi:hypothetical protein SAMN00808754_1711 [Thermanaeromonas toyohensis ToBE]|uniref:Uncharacterized protein n=1 Tax=Thermanaeromonas toyohensis ToBE TaxID=698762 RepID=A0A1W1VVP3_9FIRM|nr:hypothetical protein SAMN00808754_1711 [Thermanaeromonas toyohensis ToBE]
MGIIGHVPGALREKLGEEATQELVAFLDQTVKGLRKNISETSAERIEWRIAEIKAEIAEAKTQIIKQVAAAQSCLMREVLALLAGEAAVVYPLLKALAK